MTHASMSGGRPRTMIAILPMALPAFWPTRRRSHFQNRIVSHKGRTNGMISRTSGHGSPKCRLFGLLQALRGRAVQHCFMPVLAGIPFAGQDAVGN